MQLVTAAIIQDGDTVLVLRRGPAELWAGHWEFPGGELAPNETLQEGLERALFEALGIEVKAGEVLAVSDHRFERGEIKRVAIVTRIVSGDIQLSVHDQMRWFRLDALTSLKWVPVDIAIAESLVESKH